MIRRSTPRLATMTTFLVGQLACSGGDAITPPETSPPPLRDQIVFLNSSPNNGAGDIYKVSIDGTQLTQLSPVGTFNVCPLVSPDGSHIAYANATTLYLMNPDGSGQKSLVVLPTVNDFFYPCPSWSADSRKLAYTITSFVAKNPSPSELWSINVDGSSPKLLATGFNFGGAIWSPDGTRLLLAWSDFTGAGGPYNFSEDIVGADGSGRHRITAAASGASWSPDGSRIAFVCPHTDTFANYRICVGDSNGENPVAITPLNMRVGAPEWSPDGKLIGFTCYPSICSVNPDGSQLVMLSPTGSFIHWSPNSKSVVYLCSPGLCVVGADGSGDRVLVSLTGKNTNPTWSPLSH